MVDDVYVNDRRAGRCSLSSRGDVRGLGTGERGVMVSSRSRCRCSCRDLERPPLVCSSVTPCRLSFENRSTLTVTTGPCSTRTGIPAPFRRSAASVRLPGSVARYCWRTPTTATASATAAGPLRFQTASVGVVLHAHRTEDRLNECEGRRSWDLGKESWGTGGWMRVW